MIRRLIVFCLLLGSAGVLWAAEFELILRDAQTGLVLQGEVVYRAVDEDVVPVAGHIDRLLEESGRSGHWRVEGRAALRLTEPLAVRAEVEGYRPLHAVLRPHKGTSGWTLMLDPMIEPLAPRPRAEDGLVVFGWVHDHQTFRPVAGARIQASHDQAVAFSTAEGYFELEVRAPDVVDHRPEPFELEVSHPEYPGWRRSGLLVGAGSLSVQVGLGAPAPSPAHRSLAEPGVGPEPTRPEDSRDRLRAAPGDQPPASVRVGFADAGCTETCGRPGCLNACTHSCVFSLETYTRRGVPNEWYGSWNADALAAGAVAYRSFGAWHAFNPLPEGDWDICSNACCQVNNDQTQSGSDQAVARTAGLMLMRNQGVFRSEYSSQNNNLVGELSCSNVDCGDGGCVCNDGQAGSPSTQWPCLDDPPGMGRSCFGHGRGMSQWGNQLWTLETEPKNWKQQLDHYYNADGQGAGLRTATISQVMVIDAVRVSPAVIEPGQEFTIELDVRNLAGESHEAVLIGASIRQVGQPFIDDSGNDQPVVLPPGASTRSRSFVMPADAASGSYQLWVALWIDVDGDGVISSDDLRQHLVVVSDGLRVDDELFGDRFEQQ